MAEKINATINRADRSVAVSYKEKPYESYFTMVHLVVSIACRHGLNCNLGKDDYGTRFFYIFGKSYKDVEAAYEELKKLLD